MKTWTDYLAQNGCKTKTAYLGINESAYKQIQADALQTAADIAGDPANENWCGGSTGNARGTSMQIKSAIMAAMPNGDLSHAASRKEKL
jgi:hypothetical protein